MITALCSFYRWLLPEDVFYAIFFDSFSIAVLAGFCWLLFLMRIVLWKKPFENRFGKAAFIAVIGSYTAFMVLSLLFLLLFQVKGDVWTVIPGLNLIYAPLLLFYFAADLVCFLRRFVKRKEA